MIAGPLLTNGFDKGLAHTGLAVLACAQVAVVAGGAVQCRWIGALASGEIACPRNVALIRCRAHDWSEDAEAGGGVTGGHRAFVRRLAPRDRKSTRLNSSSIVIWYAVICLRKTTTRMRKSA